MKRYIRGLVYASRNNPGAKFNVALQNIPTESARCVSRAESNHEVTDGIVADDEISYPIRK
jgi:hypothetical protein